MKSLILLVSFISLFLAPAFSQINKYVKIDTTLKAGSILSYQKQFKQCDSTGFKSLLNDSLNNRKLQFPDFYLRNPDTASKSLRNISKRPFGDKMPCLRPEGYFPMAIVKPDSTIRYSLLIKRYWNPDKEGDGEVIYLGILSGLVQHRFKYPQKIPTLDLADRLFGLPFESFKYDLMTPLLCETSKCICARVHLQFAFCCLYS